MPCIEGDMQTRRIRTHMQSCTEFCLQFYFCDDYHLGPADPLESHVFTGVTWEMQFKSNSISEAGNTIEDFIFTF